MLTDILGAGTVYVVTGYTDMRKGIDGLAQIIEGTLGADAYSRAVYLFCGRNSTKLKALVWDGDGFLLLYKRLDNGIYRWPRTEAEAKLLSAQQLRWLMDGLEIEQKKAIQPGRRKCVVSRNVEYLLSPIFYDLKPTENIQHILGLTYTKRGVNLIVIYCESITNQEAEKP